jgi:hypothetical protein
MFFNIKGEIFDLSANQRSHGLWTPNESINQRNMKFGLMWQTKYASAVPKNVEWVLIFGHAVKIHSP